MQLCVAMFQLIHRDAYRSNRIIHSATGQRVVLVYTAGLQEAERRASIQDVINPLFLFEVGAVVAQVRFRVL